MAKGPTYGGMNVTVQVVRRALVAPVPGSAEPRHDYTVLFTTQAKVQSRTGTSEFNRVEVNGKIATHTFTIRYTTLAFDMRDRVRIVGGGLFQILSIENVDLQNQWFKIHAASMGNDDMEAAR